MNSERQQTPAPLLTSARFWVPALICVLAIAAITLAYNWGGIQGRRQLHYNDAGRQEHRIKAFFAEHPERFANLAFEFQPSVK